jgi:hypothetical protein
MLAFADMLYLFAHEFARLRGRRFTLSRIATGTLEYVFFWHKQLPSIGGFRERLEIQKRKRQTLNRAGWLRNRARPCLCAGLW